MAKILFTAFLADMRGKVNGTVFSKNRGGAYARTKVTPTNPNTSFQSAVRARLAGFSQGWRALAQAVQDSWNSAVTSFPRTNVFGNAKILSGHQLYVGLNSQLEAAGAAPITTPPLPVGAAAITSFSAAADVSDVEVELTFAPTVPTGHTMIVDATEPLSPGVSNFNSKLRQITTLAAATATGANVWAAYVAKFGAPAAGQKIGLRVRQVRLSTGEVSQNLITSLIVQA